MKNLFRREVVILYILPAILLLIGLCVVVGGFFYLGSRSNTGNPIVSTSTGRIPLASPLAIQTSSNPAIRSSPVSTALRTPAVTPSSPAVIPPTAMPTPVLHRAVDVDQLWAQMSLEQKIGQMLMAGFAGQEIPDQAAALIRDFHVGSIVYFGSNTHAPGQVLKLSRDLQGVAAQGALAIPLLIAVDHEGGTVFRFEQGVTHFPNAMAVGATGMSDLAFQVASASADELKAMGINLSLGPVLDINDEPANPVIGVRAFGGFSELVKAMGVPYIDGLQSNGVLAAAKHFPGHGSTMVDSHNSLPVLGKNYSQMQQNELMPFKAAIDHGVSIVMVSHIAAPQVDPSGLPASLSPVFLQDILRRDLGFTGVIMTDALSMGAITNAYSVGQAAVMAVRAGDDVLSYTSPGAVIEAYQALLNAARSDAALQKRIDESARRVIELKARAGLFDETLPEKADIRETEHQVLAGQVSQQAITLSGQAQPPLVKSNRILLVTPDVLPSGSVPGDNFTLFGELLRSKGVEVDEWIYSVDNPGQIAVTQSQVQKALPNYPQAIVVTYNAWLRQQTLGDHSQVGLLNAVMSSGIPTIVVAVASPYDLQLISAAQPGLATFGGLEVQVNALVVALLADTLPTGKMPVTILH